MSADNGIYIAKFPDGYRVTYASAIENIWYYPEGSDERKKELKIYFGHSNIYQTEKEAFEKAYDIYQKFLEDDDFMYIEYGISYIGELESFK